MSSNFIDIIRNIGDISEVLIILKLNEQENIWLLCGIK